VHSGRALAGIGPLNDVGGTGDDRRARVFEDKCEIGERDRADDVDAEELTANAEIAELGFGVEACLNAGSNTQIGAEASRGVCRWRQTGLNVAVHEGVAAQFDITEFQVELYFGSDPELGAGIAERNHVARSVVALVGSRIGEGDPIKEADGDSGRHVFREIEAGLYLNGSVLPYPQIQPGNNGRLSLSFQDVLDLNVHVEEGDNRTLHRNTARELEV